jgi:glycosyltransferase involved in cell wall biosynthesis
MKRPLKILVFTRYSGLGASSRLRFHQYFPYFKDNNITCKVAPFFNEKYLRDIYKNKKVNIINIIYLYVRRFVFLLTVRKYDLIWIEKEVFPHMPSVMESLITLFGVKYIVDYDDAIFHNYDRFNPYLFKNKFNKFLEKSSLVVVCNKYLSNYVNKCGAKNILHVPTVVNIERYRQKQYSVINSEFRIGWIGSPSTTKYLYIIKDVLENLSKRYNIKLVVVGGSEIENFNIPIEVHKWSEDTENAILATFDVGIMPLFDTKWERGKCGYKLIQYMASGLPVIASSIGFNKKIVDAKVGFLASSDTEWDLAFEYFIKNRGQVQTYGEYARKRAENHFSLIGWSQVLLENFQLLANNKT